MEQEKVVSENIEADVLEEEIIKQTPTQRVIRKIGRNESCPCGSNKKYKKCCIGKMDDHMYNIPLMRINYPSFIKNMADQENDQQKKNTDKEQRIIKLN